jgi:DNA replication and repair protein RecF
MAARAEAVTALARRFTEISAGLGLPEAVVSYRPRATGGRDELFAELARRRHEDLGRAYTSYGPQLDEVELRLAGRHLRRFGSQGQQRLTLLALLFAERAALMEVGREAPLMLLDDVMSELDPDHRELLGSLLETGGQAVITATEAAHVPARSAGRIEVSAGTLIAAPALRAA